MTDSARNLLSARLQNRYDELWSEGIRRIRAGTIEQDRLLKRREPDRRRGLTVIARPSPEIRTVLTGFLRRLRDVEPDQHYYLSSELHLTVLSLFTATTDYQRFFAQSKDYVTAVDAAISAEASFRVEFRGVTVSPGTIMVQGMLETDALNVLREALRRELQARGLGDGLDRRYRLETAHMTVARFRAPLSNGNRLADFLDKLRERRFGSMNVTRLSLVENDWYMTEGIVKPLKYYRLSRRAKQLGKPASHQQ